jgi:outer membrane lipoprotein SlyB
MRTVLVQERGNPGAGAAAGAAIGGVLGGALTGRGLGALVGATSGAIIGANASQGEDEHHMVDVMVRFDDGSAQLFTFQGYPPFRPGSLVSLTVDGLVLREDAPPARAVATAQMPPAPAEMPPPSSPAASAVPDPGETEAAQPSSPPPQQAPAPPPNEIPPPPVQAQSSAPASPGGQWVHTQQYGWLWMSYGDQFNYAPADGDVCPYSYVYYPAVGWTWVVAPWIWGWGPMPYFGVYGGVHYRWFGHGWGTAWRGFRPMPLRAGFPYRGGMGHTGGRGFGGGHGRR